MTAASFDDTFRVFLDKFNKRISRKESIPLDEFRTLADAVVAEMAAQRITTIDGHEAFFQRLYESDVLDMLLRNGFGYRAETLSASPSMLPAYLLLLAYVDSKRQDARAQTAENKHWAAQAPLKENSDTEFLTSLTTLLGAAPACCTVSSDLLVDALIDYQFLDWRRELLLQQYKAHWDDVERWKRDDHNWSRMRELVDEAQRTFDLGHFLFVVLADLQDETGKYRYEAERLVYQAQRHIVDGRDKYLGLWTHIKSERDENGNARFNADYVGELAESIFASHQLTYFANRTCRVDGSGNEGLFASLARLQEHHRFNDVLDDALDRRACSVARFLISQQRGHKYGDAVVQAAMCNAYAQAAPLAHWCRMVDTASGRIGEGAARARRLFVADPAIGGRVGRWSLIAALDREFPCESRWEFEALSHDRIGSLAGSLPFGNGAFKIYVHTEAARMLPPFAVTLLSEAQSPTVGLLKRRCAVDGTEPSACDGVFFAPVLTCQPPPSR